MEQLTEKGKIRSQKKSDRDALTAAEREKRSHAICQALWQMPLIQEAQAVYCYAPIGSEADIWELAERLWAAGKRLAFPRVLGAESADMEFFEVKNRKELAEGAFHVPEPDVEGRTPVDWKGAPVLVPGVAFDASGAGAHWCRV